VVLGLILCEGLLICCLLLVFSLVFEEIFDEGWLFFYDLLLVVIDFVIFLFLVILPA